MKQLFSDESIGTMDMQRFILAFVETYGVEPKQFVIPKPQSKKKPEPFFRQLERKSKNYRNIKINK